MAFISLTIGICTFIAYLSNNFYVFAFFFVGIPGFCAGIIYIPIFDNAFLYFPEKRGLISGIIASAGGFGGFSFSLLAQLIINPNNDKP